MVQRSIVKAAACLEIVMGAIFVIAMHTVKGKRDRAILAVLLG